MRRARNIGYFGSVCDFRIYTDEEVTRKKRFMADPLAIAILTPGYFCFQGMIVFNAERIESCYDLLEILGLALKERPIFHRDGFLWRTLAHFFAVEEMFLRVRFCCRVTMATITVLVYYNDRVREPYSNIREEINAIKLR
jgi:hypothetical protein